MLETRELTDAQRMLLHFGLAQVLDARNEFAEAAEHLARANALQLSQWRKAAGSTIRRSTSCASTR